MTDAFPNEQPEVSTPHSTATPAIRRRFVALIRAILDQETLKNPAVACPPRQAPDGRQPGAGATAHL